MKEIKKYFGLSNWAINNPMTVFVIIGILLLAGIASYSSMPREDFPEIIETKIYVNSIFPGNSAEDVEKLVTKPLEEEIKNISGVGKITSSSFQDYSSIIVEFTDDDLTPEQAKRKVKDQIDVVKAESNWPTLDNGGPVDPSAFDLNISEVTPIININLTGNYTKQQLKEFGEILEDRIESLPEIKEADVLGVDEREVEVAVNLNRMTAADVSLNQVIGAIQSENVTVSGGNIISNGLRRNIRVIGEINNPSELNNIVVKNDKGTVFLKDIAQINFREKDKTTYARNYGEPVVMVSVMKKSGTNLIKATDGIRRIIDDAKTNILPPQLSIEMTNDSSDRVKNQVSELENSIIFGVLLVVGVLMFFLGFRNALFVGIAIPLSMLLSFLLLPILGGAVVGGNISLNTMTLFASVMGLGMLVDNGIVVVENVFRKLDQGLSREEAARQGVGEIAWPIIASTGTTLAAFLPLAFWPGIMGKFMVYFPLTLSMVLGSSLFVALVVNSMLTSRFMSLKEGKMSMKSLWMLSGVFLVLGLLFLLVGRTVEPTTIYGKNAPMVINSMPFVIFGVLGLIGGIITSLIGLLFRSRTRLMRLGGLVIFGGLMLIMLGFMGGKGAYTGFGNLFVLMAILLWAFKFVLTPASNWFQGKALPAMEKVYQKFLGFALKGRLMPYVFFLGTVFLFISAIMAFGIKQPKTEFFPDNVANQAIVYIEYPEGTDIEKTNTLTKEIEQQVMAVAKHYVVTENDPDYGYLAKAHGNGYNRMVESVISQVGQGSGDPNTDTGQADLPHKGKVTINFRQFKYRDGTNTNKILEDVRSAIKGYPGVTITAEKEANGPPAGPPINVELAGDNYDELIETAIDIKQYLDGLQVAGVEELKLDVNTNKPELEIYVDRKKAGDLGVSTGVIGQALRQAVYGWETSTFKDDKEDYDIVVRLDSQSRYNEEALFNQIISFYNNQGQFIKVPISSVITKRKTTTFSSIKRKNLKRIISIHSNTLEGFNGTEIVGQLNDALQNYNMPAGITFSFTGEQEEQAKQMAFLSSALGIAFALIFLILVAQFNSLSKPIIILLAVLLSFIGVLFGLLTFNLTFVVIMTMMGIISLAGIVVNNAIVLIDYTQLMIDRKKVAVGIEEDDLLTRNQFREAIIEGGTARLRPVLLTAITTILGLVPLAMGFNVNFFSLFTNYDPQIYIGGDNTIFWQPMCLTIIFGLTFATFLTLVIVPVLFFLRNRAKIRFAKSKQEGL